MGDLISRQAAIDAICEDIEWLESQGCTDITLAERRRRDVDILTALPAAEVPEVVRCRDCVKHNVDVGNYVNGKFAWRDDACPLVQWRGKAWGGEFDYQFCCYGERRVDNGESDRQTGGD